MNGEETNIEKNKVNQNNAKQKNNKNKKRKTNKSQTNKNTNIEKTINKKPDNKDEKIEKVEVEIKEEKKENIENKVDSNTSKNQEIENAKITELKQDKPNEQESEEPKQKNEIDVIRNYEKKKGKNKIIVAGIILVIFVILGLLVYSTIFAFLNINNTKIIEGVYINEINVSNMEIEDIRKNFNDKFNSMYTKDIKLKYEEFETVINLEQIGAKIEYEQAITEAYNKGRKNNIFQNNYEILELKKNPINLDINISYDDSKLEEIVQNISLNLPGTVVQSSYYIDGDTLIITSGTKGVVINKEQLINLLNKKIKIELKEDITQEVILPVIEKEPDKIDIDKIHSEIYQEPKDAYVVKEPLQVFVHVNGVDFNVDEAKKAIKEPKEEYEIPLIITEPEITTDKLGDEAFPNLLGSFSTNYGSSASNRGINIGIAANTINGTILMPGQVFSYNNVIGDTTPNKGYRLGGAYLNGELVQSYGGGICQVSSTLYNAVLYANLEIVQRFNHSSPVGYVPAGRDATVSYGGKDFKFKNSRQYPIKIKAIASNGVLKVEIYGIEEETEYEVVIESRVTGYLSATTKYVETSSLPKGQERVKSSGSRGFKSVAYRVLKINGEEISRTLLSQDTYNPMQRIVEVGTGT